MRYILAVDVGVVLVGHGAAGGLDLLRLWVRIRRGNGSAITVSQSEIESLSAESA